MAKLKNNKKLVQGATFASTSFNLINTIIGSGSLMLPYDAKNTGYVFIVILNILVAVLSSISFLFISQAAEYTQLFTYRSIADRLYKKWFGILSTFCLIVYTFGSCMSYTIIIKNNMFWWDDTINSEYTYKVILMWGICLVIALPLSLLQKIDFLKYTSIVALAAMAYVILLTVVFSCVIMINKNGVYDEIINNRGELKPFVFTQQTAIALPLLGAAYTGHYNSALLYKELRNRNSKTMTKVVALSLTVCFVCYSLIGIFGYLAFGNAVDDNIITSLSKLPSGVIFAQIACVFVMLVVLSSFPLVSFSIKNNIASLIMGNNCVKRKHILKAKQEHRHILEEKANEDKINGNVKEEEEKSLLIELSNEKDEEDKNEKIVETKISNEINDMDVDVKEQLEEDNDIKEDSVSLERKNPISDNDDNNEVENQEAEPLIHEESTEKGIMKKEIWELDETDENDLKSVEFQIARKYDIIIGIAVVLIALLITSFVNSISDLVSFTSALCGTPIVFIFPSFFEIAVLKEKKVKKSRIALPIIVLIFGFFFMIMGLYSAIYNQVEKRKIE